MTVSRVRVRDDRAPETTGRSSRNRRRTTVAVAGLVLAACGGGADPATSDAPSAASATTADVPDGTVASGPITTAPPSTEPATSGSTTEPPPTEPTTSEPTTTVPPPEPVAFDLSTLPDLVASLESTVADGDPLLLARELGGFPYDIPVPAGSTTNRIDSTVRADVDGGMRRHELSYSVVAPGGTVPDVDITLDDNGPGSVEITEIWDPIMTRLGFERANSTGSDPGDPGGPNSVNHVYVPTDAVPPFVNGVPATPGNVFVWSDEDVTGAASGLDPTDPVGGYRIDADAETPEDGPIAVPLLAALVAELPVPDGVVLTGATLRLESRAPDAYEFDRGARYVSLSLEWSAPAGATVDDLAEFYADPSVFRGDVLVPAEPSFFEDGVYEPATIEPYGDTDRWLPLLLLHRYEGTLRVEAPYDDTEPVTIGYDVTLDPADVELAPAG